MMYQASDVFIDCDGKRHTVSILTDKWKDGILLSSVAAHASRLSSHRDRAKPR